VKWWEVFHDQLLDLGNKAKKSGMRLSMHPGQYTVLNSPDEMVVYKAIEDLRYHTRFLDALGLGSEHKIILHIGGTYGDKPAAIERFIKQYRLLDDNIRQRLVIENDDRQYRISDVLPIGLSEGIPVVFDNLHHEVNPDHSLTMNQWITASAATWREKDGPQKMHYSQQDAGKRSGSHSPTINVDQFLDYYQALPSHEVDIMLEVKDKNLSAVKCINAIALPWITRLDEEWSRYKYLILEHSPKHYHAIRELLKDKKSYPVVEFYRLIGEAMMIAITPGTAVNAIQHIWGYVSAEAGEQQTMKYEQLLQKVYQGASTLAIKRLLWKLSIDQQHNYLTNQLYFMELL